MLIEDIRNFFHYQLIELGDANFKIEYLKMRKDGELKYEFKHLETESLSHLINLSKFFSEEWI